MFDVIFHIACMVVVFKVIDFIDKKVEEKRLSDHQESIRMWDESFKAPGCVYVVEEVD